ncbi:hypothetical protein SAMN05660485_02469 [Blastococcus fimeti]|nr:hypothetical protein SAMN05660485_02469 [Blastococcus fimeti]
MPVLWLALAAAQSRLGRLEPEVRDRALVVIDSGEDLVSWQRLGPEAAAGRTSILAVLRAQLTGPQGPHRAVRRPYRYVTDLEPGDVLVWRASTGVVVPLRVVQVRDERAMAEPVLEQLAWDGSGVPPEEVLAALPRAPTPGHARGAHWAGPLYRPFKLRRRDPDWPDLGFTVCGSVAPRPGDDGDMLRRASGLFWAGLPLHLEHAVTGRWPEDPAPAGEPAG